MTSTQEELIRYRIEKRMAGRRDIILHIIVYLLVLALALINLPWWDTVSQGFIRHPMGHPARFTVPALLLSERRRRQKARRRNRARDRTAARVDPLDEDEELLIEERVSKKITARRWIVAHFLVMVCARSCLGPDRGQLEFCVSPGLPCQSDRRLAGHIRFALGTILFCAWQNCGGAGAENRKGNRASVAPRARSDTRTTVAA